MTHAVKIEAFEGPIDLLLHLITRQRVDIYEVSLATIARDYLAAVEASAELDLEGVTGFLVVAATLLELKSARLLPSRSSGGEDGAWLEERDLLLSRLVECATFRDAGAWLGGRLDSGAQFHPRTAGPEPQFLHAAREVMPDVSLVELVTAAQRVLAPVIDAFVDTSHVPPIQVSVREALVEVAAQLVDARTSTFRDLCRTTGDRIEVVVRFLALLELFKAGAVELTQAERFGDIAARWTGGIALEAILADVEEYALAEGSP